MLSQSTEKTGGVDAVAEIPNLADRTTEKQIMEGWRRGPRTRRADPAPCSLEDIRMVDDRGIQGVLKEVDTTVRLALKTASEELKQKIFNNMSDAAQLIKEDMEYMALSASATSNRPSSASSTS